MIWRYVNEPFGEPSHLALTGGASKEERLAYIAKENADNINILINNLNI